MAESGHLMRIITRIISIDIKSCIEHMLELLWGMIFMIWLVDTRFPANTAPGWPSIARCNVTKHFLMSKSFTNHPNMNRNIEIIKHIIIFTGQKRTIFTFLFAYWRKSNIFIIFTDILDGPILATLQYTVTYRVFMNQRFYEIDNKKKEPRRE